MCISVSCVMLSFMIGATVVDVGVIDMEGANRTAALDQRERPNACRECVDLPRLAPLGDDVLVAHVGLVGLDNLACAAHRANADSLHCLADAMNRRTTRFSGCSRECASKAGSR